MRLTLIALLAATVATPALADAVTYTGTLGKLPIIVELSSDPAAPDDRFVGRYAYMSKGIDIPLDAVSVTDGKLELAEELPCDETSCDSTGDTPPPPRLGAKWRLETAGTSLAGTWSDNGETLPVTLELVGIRPFEVTDPLAAANLAEVHFDFFSSADRLTPETDPYDWAKLDVPLELSPQTTWDDSAFQYATDPRTKFPYPRLVKAGDTDIAPANALLKSNQFAMSADALNCPAHAYLGLGWYSGSVSSIGTLAGYEDETVEVTYLTPKLLTWLEAGSLFCGGAYPENHARYYNLDLATGDYLDLSRIFKGWIFNQGADITSDLEAASQNPRDYRWGPDTALADFVRAHRTSSDDAAFEEECGIDDLIASNLAISFAQGDIVSFRLSGLPHVSQACEDVLYSAPITELRELLAPTAADYFPALNP